MSAAPARTRITKTNNHHHTRSIIFLGLLVALSCCLMVLQRHATQPAQNNAGASGLLQPEAERGSAAQHVIGEGVAAAARAPAQTTVDAATGARLREQYGKLPLQFEANAGQTTAQEVKFLSRGSGYTLFLTPTEAVFSLSSLVGSKPAGKGNTRLAEKRLPSGNRGAAAHKTGQASAARRRQSAVLRMQLVGGNAGAQVSQAEELPGKVNYFPGNDPQKWRTDVSTYQKVQFEAVYPGIDMIYYGNQRQLEYDFIVAPDTDPGTIRLKFVGAQRMRVNEGGELVLKVKGGGEVKQHKPVIYQEVCGARTEVKGHYVLRERMEVGFEVAEYDTTKPLVIDPTIVYSTYLGGNDFEDANGIAVDSDGNAYVTGRTTSINFPRINALQPAFGGGDYDAFVTKLNAAGSALMYSTYLGGSDYDEAHDIAVDANGNAYVAGFTRSDNFPLANALQSAFGGGYTDAFVTKLNAAGSALMYSTYLGGSEYDEAPGIAVDANGNAYIAGYTESLNFPLANALQSTFSGFTDAFVTKLNAAGSALVYSTYLGGNYLDNAYGIAVDASGSAYVAGVTSSDNFPLADALQSAFSGFTDAFVTKLNAAGSALIYSTYLGGTEGDYAFGIAVDSDGNAYVTGFTRSDNFPLANALQSAYGGESDAFVTKLNAAGSALVYSTYLGGSDYDRAHGIAVDANGNAYVAGFTRSVNFPLANALQSAYGGGESDAFVTKLNAAGSALMYSTYFGGILDEGVNGIASSASGTYIVGSTNSYDFPTTQEALQNTGSSGDAFIARINENTNTTYYAIRGRITDILGNPVSAGGLIVTLSGTQNRTVTTSFDGTYFFPLLPGGGDYTVTPENTFTYTPSQRSYTRLAGNIADANFASENFTSKVRISGRVSNVNGRSLSATVRVSGDVTAEQNVNGSYSFLVPQGGTYTITAEKSPASFSPRTVANVTRDVNNVNFVVTAPLVSITGQLTNLPPDSINPQVNVSGTGLPSNPCDVSRQNGAVIYICAGLSVYGDYTVIPASQIYNFDPPVRGYQEIANNVFDANFAAQIGYTISGQVTGAGVGLGGVTVSLSGSASATAVTNASGNYTFPGLAAGGTYTVTPNNTALYSFTPQTVSNLQANQSLDFAGTLRTYTISGRITEGTNGLSSVLVTLTGPPGFTPRTFATQADGAYSFAGLSAGSNYTVQAARTNYTFTPASIAVINLLTDRAGANFAGTLQTFAISGRVMSGTSGLSGVTMTLSGGQTGTTQTDASGNYTFPNLAAGGTYTVTPNNTALYSFTPRTVSNLQANQSLDFAGTLRNYTVSGQVTGAGVGLGGVTVSLSGSASATAVTNASGNYSFPGLTAGGTYTVTPNNTALYSFTPRTVSNLQANQSLDFVGTLRNYAISGRVLEGTSGLSGVLVTLTGPAGFTPRTFITQADGNYSFAGVPAGSNYTLQAARTNYTFTPANIAVINLLTDRAGANFAGTLQTFAISGRVMSGTSGLSGVTMTLSGGQTGTTQTDASGNYTFPNLAAGGTYTVTPTKTNYNFDPANRSFPNLSGNQTGNFAGALATFTISGQVTVGGTGLSGVIVNLSGGQASAVTTDQAGNYSFANLPAGSNYTLTPSRANYSFSPASVQVTNLSANQSNANFAATLLTYTISGRITLGGAALNAVNVALRGTQTANISTNASGDYSFTVAAGGSYTVTPSNANHSFAPSSTSFNNLSSNQTANFTASLIPAVFQFSAASYQVGEADGRVTVTITRTGDTSSAVMMDYQTTDSDTFTVGCADTVNNQGGAYARCDFATTVGALHFVAGETQKTIIVPIINDGYSESPETFQVRLSNAVGATLGTPNATTVTIQDNDGAGAPNPLTTMIPFFVRQQYLDFLSREPEAGEPWSGVMNRCADVNTGPTVNTDCDRIAVSAAFFGSPEFQLKGFYVFRFYKLAFNRLPQYLEIVPDMSFVAGATPEEVYARKAQLATQFTQRREFQTSYGQMSNADYVAALMNRYQLAQITTPDPAQPDGTTKLTLTASELVSRLDSSTLTRAQLFRAVADSDQVAQLEFNSAFVAVQYYGYLRRTPEETGYRNNLNALQRGVSFREMVNAFLNSVEYKLRFGQP